MKILVCPLNWGLGHAARCVPIINILLQQGHKVTLAGYGRSLSFLEQEFPQLSAERLLGKTIRYNSSKHLLMGVAIQLPSFFLSVIEEHFAVAKIIRNYRIQMVISDNRFGVWNRKTKNIYISHQLRIQLGSHVFMGRFMEEILEHSQKYVLAPFQEVWTPDVLESPSLSGKLSHSPKRWKNQVYIGPLSRFTKNIGSASQDSSGDLGDGIQFEILALVSGPEPARETFEKLLLTEMNKIPGKHILVQGKPELTKKHQKIEKSIDGNVHVYPHMSGDKLFSLINSAKYIICRSGYTTVMELASLEKKNVMFVPTPGQPEQLYLAEKYQEEQIAPYQHQEKLNISHMLNRFSSYKGFEGFAARSPNLTEFLARHPFLSKN